MKKENYKSRKFKGILMFVIAGVIVNLVGSQISIKPVQAATTYLKTQTLSTLPQTKHIQLSRGSGHDRQYPGVWLKAGQIIKARQTNPLFKSNINFDLSADDAAKEVQGKIASNGTVTTLTAKADSVPFVHTPLVAPGGPQPVIEYEIETSSEEVPIYVEGDNEQLFQNKWKASNAPFAIFDSTRVQMLVPIIDRDKLFSAFGGSMLQLAQFYTYLLERYDRYAGLEDNPVDSIDLNVRAKYFLKANGHGHGWAYYSVDHVAQNALRMSDLMSVGHGLYHEIGHGYDLGAEDIDLTEMWNNIYAYYMETASPYPVTPWLYSGVTIDKNENEPYGSFRSRLQFFIDMFDFVGPEKAMKDFNKAYRRALAKGPLPMTMTEFIIRTFSTSSGYNFASYFENKGFPVSQELKRWSFEQGFKNITSMQPLYGISTQAGTIAKAETARQALGLAHRYTLVPTAKAQLLNTNASLTVDVKAPDMSVLQGREVILYDGNTEINRQTIVGNKVVFNNVPLGEYTVKLPTMPTGLYRYDEFNYVTVTEKGATLEANYEILTQTVYRNDVNINFRGLGNALFTKINYNSQSHSIDVEKLGATPHAYYTTTYASYKIYDANNNVVDAADFNGKDNSSFKRTSPFLEGYKLEIFHSEPSRVTMMAEIDNQNIYKQTAKTATYTLRDGLFVLNGDKRTSIDILQDMLRTYLNNLVAKYGKDQAKTRIYNSAHANVIASTIAQMPLPDQQEILKEYPDLFQQLKIISPAPFTAKIGDAQSTTQTELTQKMTYESNGEFTAVADWKDVPVQSGVFSTGGIYPVHYALTDFFMFQANTDVMLTVATDTEKPVLNGIAPTVELVEGDTFDPKAGILATDNIDGDVTSKIVVSGTVDTTKAGTYILTYTVTDKAGNSTTTTQTVTVKAKVNPDTEKPVLSGIAPTVELVEGDPFDPKAGISATDNIDGDVTNKIVVSGTVDTTKVGTYTLTYTVTDKAGNSTTFVQSITVKAKVIPDTEKPVLNGIAPTVELVEGDTFDPKAGILATDNIDGDVTSKIVVSGTVDTTKAGTYTLTYTVTDKAGNSTTFVQSITVKAKVNPMARIEIIKIDKKSAVSLAGVEFDIRDLNGKIVDHIITNTQGKALSKYLVLGSYTLFETKTPVGYISDMMPIIVTLSKENAIITIVNESLKEDKKPDVIKGKLIISKFDKETGHRLSGMVFKLKHRITGQEKIIDMQDYNVFEITDMAEGEYDVVEMRAPAGYEIDSTIYTITIAKNGDVKLLSIYDLRKSETKVAPQVEEKKGNIALPQTGVDHNENMMKLLLVGIISFVLAIIVCFRNRNLK